MYEWVIYACINVRSYRYLTREWNLSISTTAGLTILTLLWHEIGIREFHKRSVSFNAATLSLDSGLRVKAGPARDNLCRVILLSQIACASPNVRRHHVRVSTQKLSRSILSGQTRPTPERNKHTSFTCVRQRCSFSVTKKSILQPRVKPLASKDENESLRAEKKKQREIWEWERSKLLLLRKKPRSQMSMGERERSGPRGLNLCHSQNWL